MGRACPEVDDGIWLRCMSSTRPVFLNHMLTWDMENVVRAKRGPEDPEEMKNRAVCGRYEAFVQSQGIYTNL